MPQDKEILFFHERTSDHDRFCADLLREGLNQMHISHGPELLDKLLSYYHLVLSYNEKVNLTSITDPSEFMVKHFLDSFAICADSCMENASSVIDVGTGGGFPGMPLAMLYPDKSFVLLDSLQKRIVFLKDAADKLGLHNVIPIQGRAEDLGRQTEHREKYDLCVSRAVARLSVLSEYCLPFVKVNGFFVAYKTKGEDLSLGEHALSLLGGQQSKILPFPSFQGELSQHCLDHQLLFVKKKKATPAAYPRKAGLPAKSPL